VPRSAAIDRGYAPTRITPPLIDDTAAVLVKGYRYGADRRRRFGARAFRTRIMGPVGVVRDR
jgi:hypothetical protein